jgi:hypothetical protein
VKFLFLGKTGVEPGPNRPEHAAMRTRAGPGVVLTSNVEFARTAQGDYHACILRVDYVISVNTP